MTRRPPRTTLTDTLCPYPKLFRYAESDAIRSLQPQVKLAVLTAEESRTRDLPSGVTSKPMQTRPVQPPYIAIPDVSDLSIVNRTAERRRGRDRESFRVVLVVRTRNEDDW